MMMKILMKNGESYDLPITGYSDVLIKANFIQYKQYWTMLYEGREPLDVPGKYWFKEIDSFKFEEED